MQEFLLTHTSKKITTDFVSTHTRIGDKELNIYGGNYCIKANELSDFWNKYYEYVIEKGNAEYLTEKQYGLAMAVDFDFRYCHDVETRQHTKQNVSDMICLYLESLKKYLLIEPNVPFDAFVFEKSNVNRLEDGSLTKDGIHVIFGLQVGFETQQIIRQDILKELKDIWDLPLINSWDSVLDEGISKGSTNWQLYGSKKPNNQAYQLTYHYKCEIDSADNEFMINELNISDFDFKNNFPKLSVQYPNNPTFQINPKYAVKKLSLQKPYSPTSVTQVPLTEEEEKMSDIDYLLQVCIKDKMCKEQDHKDWYKIGQALKNELGDDAIDYFVNWTYNFGTENKKKEAIQHITKYIKKTPLKDKDRLTIKSIHYYARQSNEQKYKARFCKAKEFIADEDIEEILKEPTENEIAKYFVKKWGSKFKCVDIKNKTVYGFTQNNLWEQIDSCSTIREIISNELSAEFKKYRDAIWESIEKLNENIKEFQDNKKKIGAMSDNIIRFGKTDAKNNITREILDKIIEPEFENMLNKQKYILPIKNGKILNIKTLEIEERTIEHKFSYECNADYIEMTQEQEKEAEQYFLDLFCGNKDTMMCVMDILKSIMTGETLRYIYFFTGAGSNGKSLLFTILNSIFNKSMDTIDTRVILETNNSSSLTTEFEKLDKCRFGYVTELDEKDKLNVKTIKKISGGDPIDYRGLYKGNKTVNPTVNLGVVTNILPDFKAQTAIINRIIVIPFNNTFENNKSFETEMLLKKDIIFSYIMKHGTIRDKFNLTEEMLVAKQDYIDDNETIDYLKDFINNNYDIVNFVKKEKVVRDTFRDNYNTYLKTKGLPIDKSSNQKFTRLIKGYNIGSKESNGKTYFTGLVEKDADESDIE
jgi:P4 family phage/plasmid primase-like protien